MDGRAVDLALMFSRGTSELIDALPSLDGLDGPWARRRLSEAYLEILAARDVFQLQGDDTVSRDIRRLVSALELYVLARPSVDEHVSAAAFVAAEALEIWSAKLGVELQAALKIEAGLLFVIAGFDANAAATAPNFEAADITTAEGWTLASIGALLAQSSPEDRPPPSEVPPDRSGVIADALWRRMGTGVQTHHAWLRGAGDQEESPGRRDLELVAATLSEVPGAGARYARPVHWIGLLLRALRATERRSLRRLAAIEGMASYVAATVARRPLLWPAAEIFADRCLESLMQHVAVAVPTGSGKSAVAELAVVRAISEGWCLYLAPTNALVAQIRRDLREPVVGAGGEIRSFVGGGEYTTEESLGEEIGPGDLFVMTPERCALALRQSPAAFADLRLLIVDECHLVGSGGTRGVVTELVIAEILARSSSVSAILMSALVSNASELAEWLELATDREALGIQEAWRPTRTLRGVVGISKSEFEAARSASEANLAARPHRVSRHNVPLSTMVGLQGAWATTGAFEDFAVVGLPASVEAQFRTTDRQGDVESWRNRAAESLSVALATAGEHVLTFVPANKHEVITVARAIAAALPERELELGVSNHVALAEYELGRESEVGHLLARGVATHSAALIDDERRASEMAFGGRNPSAPVMVATTSLAQGLNLPATVVVITGTQIGHGGQGQTRTARDLLNAIGRAGRPFVANRSLALIVPSKAGLLSAQAPPANVLSVARFIGLEDAAAPLESQLLSLLRQNPDYMGSLDAMSEEELAAFTYLPRDDEVASAADILTRSLGYHQRRLEIGPNVESTVEALTSLGTNFLRAGGTPEWLVQVAYMSAIDLRDVAALYRAATAQPAEAATVETWAAELIRLIALLPPPSQERLCQLEDVPEPLQTELRRGEENAWASLSATVAAYLAGEPLSVLGEAAFSLSREDGRRSASDPLPKAIALVRQLLSYRLSIAAGGLQAMYELGLQRGDERLEVPDASLSALEQLPLSLRVGCGSRDSRLWSRYGVQGRRLAHMLAELLPVPAELATEPAIRAWMRARLHAIGEDVDALGALDEPAQRAVVAASASVT